MILMEKIMNNDAQGNHPNLFGWNLMDFKDFWNNK
jgi:hypothetical protein